MLNGRVARLVLVVVVFSVVASCGGGVIPKLGGTAQGSVSGVVFKGPVAAGAVRALKLSATLERGAELASTTTDADGAFEMKLPPYSGPLLIVASSGTYTEEAIGLGVKLDGNELTALVPSYTGGAVISGLRVTPISTLATSLTTFHVQSDGKAVVDAHDEARLHLHKHFGDLDWGTVSPADLSVAGVTNLSPEARAGLILSGLSWLAKQQAEASDLTPGLTVNAATLTSALARDASDGTLDGRAATEQLKQAKVSLTGLTLRADLVQAMSGFINSPRNASALRLQDITTFLAVVGTNSDPYLFCPGQVPAATCGSGPVDTEPPVLAFIRPNSGAGVAGSTQVEVRASDNTKLKTLKFTAPPSLEATTAVFTNAGRDGVLTAVLDVSALMDGPLELRAEVTDDSGNPAAKSITITVSNLGPRITIAAPGDGSVVRGTSVPVVASATAQAPGATISRIELIAPPAGMGPDVLPAADSFSANWNTSAAFEGGTTLTVRATDSFGTATETAVTVTVDNVPFGKVSAVVSAGAPVDGLTVKLVAIDEATGLPVVGRLGGSILGQSTDVTADGGVAFELSQENYTGPVQVVASGSGASYVDPSDGVTAILLPATFTFTTYVSSYQAGDRLDVPVSFWTTLADEAARAYALGRNPSQTTPILLVPALRAIDPLFARHITSQAWAVRSAYPAPLTTTPQSLRDVVYAALPDVGLNQEARDLAEQVGLTPGTGFGAPQLVAMLRQDIADGQFDGRSNGVQLRTGGVTPYDFDSNTTRFHQAIGLDRFIRNPQNRTGLTRQDLQTQSIYDTMSGDTSLLYSTTVGPIPFDNAAPVVTWVVTFTNAGTSSAPAVLGTTRLVAGQLSIQATAVDVSGVASIAATADTTPLAPGTGSTSSRLVSVFDVSTRADGPLTLAATACDRLANCATTTFEVEVDNTVPSITIVKPVPSYFASVSFAIEALAADNQRVATFDVTPVAGVTGLVDQDAAVARVFVPAAAWQFGMQLADGTFAGKARACDLVRNCAEATLATIDRTAPQVAITSTVPVSTRTPALTLSGTVTDGVGAGVSRVLVSLNGGTAQPATLTGSTWTSALTLADGTNSIAVWAEDLAVTPNSGQGKPSPASAAATIILDTAPPTVAWTVTFTNGTFVGSAPVGGSKLVAGMLRVEANASDSSSVASIDVKVGATLLSPGSGSSASRHLSLLDTAVTGEGSVTLTATSCDGLGNCGTSTYVVTVDRTGPTITVLKPAPVFVSAAFDIEATATDSQGLASLDVTAPAGIADQDAQVSRAFVPGTSWTLSAADGAFPVGFGGCDVVGNCVAATAGVTVDKTPPTLAWVTQPPQYTRSNLVNFSVTATDGAGAGVQRVLAGIDYLNPVVGVLSGSTWTFTNFNLGLVDGAKNLRVWAEDLAVPSNSGQMSGYPAADLGASTLRDTANPTLVPASYRAFKDEDGITLGTGSTGQPLVPAQYNFGAAPNRVIDLGAGSITIKKADTLTAAAANRPMLTWQIPLNSSNESPITSVTWSATRNSCRPDFGTCSTVAAGSGSLSVDGAVPSPVAGNVYYSQELTMPAKGTYAFTYTATDAAGNSASRSFTVVWDVGGPPLVVIPDVAWESSADPQSALPLRIADGSFGRLFGIGLGGFVNNQARLRKYYVYNAAPQEVAVSFRAGGSNNRATNEGWTNILGNLFGAEGGGSYSVDGHTFDRDYMSTWSAASDYCADSGKLIEPYPCTRTASSFPYIRHVRGQVAKWECFGNVYSEGPTNYGPVLINGTAATASGATDSTVDTQFVSPPSAPGTGNETSLASLVVFGANSGGRVPAATSTAPGVMAVYVVVPIQAHQTPMSTVALPHLGGGTGKYQYYFADMVDASGANAPVPSGVCNGVSKVEEATFYWYRRLATAVTTVSAVFSVESGGGFFLGGITGNVYYSGVTARPITNTSAAITINH